MSEDKLAGSTEVAEKPVTYGKKAQITAIALTALIFGGLVIQTIYNVSAANKKQAAKDEAANVNKPSTLGDSQQSMGQFREAQDKAKTEIDALNAAKVAKENAAKNAASFVDRTTAGNPAISNAVANGANQSTTGGGQRPVTVADIYKAFDLAETERVLNARRSPIASSSGAQGAANGGQQSSYQKVNGTATVGNPSELNREQSLIESNKAQIAEIRDNSARLMKSVEQTNPELYKRATGNDAVAAAPVASQSEAISFGQTANNRTFLEPGSGAKSGEKLVPTSTELSAVLQQDVISDFPNTWIAVLQRPIYDIANENILLPTGTRLMGTTSNAAGVNEVIQNRLGMPAQWIIRPDGKRIDLKKVQGLDAAGIAGLKDEVDYHILAQVLGVAAYAVVGLGPSTSNFGTAPQSAASQAVAEATTQSRQIGRSVAQKYLSIVPTKIIRAGTPMKIILEDDIYVTPWKALTAGSYHYAE